MIIKLFPGKAIDFNPRRGKLLFIETAVALVALCWVVDAVVDAYLFGHGGFVDMLFFLDAHHLWMRVFMAVPVVVFALYTGSMLGRQKEKELELRETAEKAASLMGQDFFDSLVEQLSVIFDARYALVGELAASGTAVKTVSVWADGKLADNINYKLEGTPCQGVLYDTVCLYRSGVQEKFPKDTLLVEMGVVSYRGFPLRDSGGVTVGLIAVLDDKAIVNRDLAVPELSVLSARAAAELKRYRSERGGGFRNNGTLSDL